MMKIFNIYSLAILIIYLLPVMAYAQEHNDTTGISLKEIVVEGNMQSASPEKVTYRPTGRIKNASQDAIDLLMRMAIPQISVNPLTKEVKSAGGEKTSIFINYQPARDEDIKGMRTADVRSVEYLDYPTDARFMGAEHVINIIVQEYLYGGYTKISDRQFLFSGFSNYASLFSKFTYKKLIYDLYVAADNVSSKHVGNSQISSFKLPNGEITRNANFTGSNFKYVDLPISFRASYASENIQISNTFAFRFNDRYKGTNHGHLYFVPGNGTDYNYTNQNPYIGRSWVWNGEYYFMLKKDWSLSISPNLIYSHDYLGNTYSTTVPGEETIVNNAKENALNIGITASLRKQLSKIHTFSLNFSGQYNKNDVTYSGSSPFSTDISGSNISGNAGYTLSLTTFNLNAKAGIESVYDKANYEKYKETYPYANLSVSIAPNSKHYLYVSSQLSTYATPFSWRSPNTIQVNELLYRTGSPLLKNSKMLQASANYTYIPTNKFSVTAFASYLGVYKRAVYSYSQFNDGNALLMSYINSGDLTKTQVGANATFSLLNNSLMFQASPILSHYNSSGNIRGHWTPLTVSAYCQYFFKNFNLSAYWSSRSREIHQNSFIMETSRSNYFIQLGWSNGAWNLSLYASNVFRSGYDGSWSDLTTPSYSEYKVSFNGNYRRSVALTAIYTFGYGKKIQRGNEIGRQSGAASAVMQ